VRTEALVRRILTEAWALRRIQAHCQSAIKGNTALSASGSAQLAPPHGHPPLFDDASKRLTIFKDRISAASGDERIALAKVLSALVKELG
jgi:hypothetical protein